MQKKFITYCIIFFTPLIIIFISLERLTLKLPSNFKTNQEAISLKKNQFKTLILGSSQIMTGINAEWFSYPTLNLASGSQHHNIDFALFKKFKPQLENLQTVVVEVSYSHFELPHNGKSFWKNPLYLKYYDINLFGRNTYFKDRLIFLANPPLFFKHLKNHYIHKEINYTINDYGFNTTYFDGNFKSLKYNESEIKKNANIDINITENLNLLKLNSTYFFEMLDSLSDQNLNIIICKAPMYKTFLTARNNAILKRRDSILEIVSNQYNNVTILDLEEDTLSFKVTHFQNESHLNPDGAKIFTEKLNSLINNLE